MKIREEKEYDKPSLVFLKAEYGKVENVVNYFHKTSLKYSERAVIRLYSQRSRSHHSSENRLQEKNLSEQDQEKKNPKI